MCLKNDAQVLEKVSFSLRRGVASGLLSCW
jgi:hypothetical protein